MKRKHPVIFKSILALAVVGGCLLADSNLRIVTTEYTLRFSALPAAFDGFRIVQLSDVHGAVYGKDNARLLGAVRDAAPDLIAITGDLADKNSNPADINALLSGLTAIAPVYFVSGNHEWAGRALGALQTMFRAYGVRYLRNESVTIERGGERVVLAGVEDPNGWADQPKPDAVAAALPEGFRILLAHRNYWAEAYPDLPVDLILCGHAHGGVVRLPGVGGLLDHHGKLFPAYTDGVFTSGRYDMVVSRGLGNIAGIPRFCNNPEIVVVTLKTE